MSVSLEVWLEQVSRMANERAARVTDATPLDLASSLAAAFRGRGLRSLADVLSAGLDSNENYGGAQVHRALLPRGRPHDLHCRSQNCSDSQSWLARRVNRKSPPKKKNNLKIGRAHV
jgi:hypothetical protein